MHLWVLVDQTLGSRLLLLGSQAKLSPGSALDSGLVGSRKESVPFSIDFGNSPWGQSLSQPTPVWVPLMYLPFHDMASCPGAL